MSQKKLMDPKDFKEYVCDQFTKAFGIVTDEKEIVQPDESDGLFELMEIYVSEVSPLLDILEASSEDAKWKDTWSLLHNIKGSSAILNKIESNVIVEEIDKCRGDDFPQEWDSLKTRIIGMTRAMIVMMPS